MKKWLITAPIFLTLAACSVSNESKQQANDNFEQYAEQKVSFSPLQSGGVTLPPQDPTYQMPNLGKVYHQSVDIRPPSTPIAMINKSYAQFDGERAFIVYPVAQQGVYNLEQVERLLKEQGISYTTENGKIQTGWTSTTRTDDIGDTQIRYLIEQVHNQQASALFVSVLQMKRDNVIFTPSVVDKQRYASDRLNQLIGELNQAYRKQQQDLHISQSGAIPSQILKDINGRLALAMGADFYLAWQRLAPALSSLGFETVEENPGRGYRELKYRPLESSEWLRLGVADPELEKGDYAMQLAAYSKESAVVITDKKGNALPEKQTQILYQALQTLLAK